MKKRLFNITVVCVTVSAVLLLLTGFNKEQMPGRRLGALPIRDINPIFKSSFPDISNARYYRYDEVIKTEWPQVLYTRRGGFIDIDHVYNSIDKTLFLYYSIRDVMRKSGKNKIFKIDDGFDFYLKFDPPAGHKSEQDANLALNIASYLVYQQNIWHEITTWYGYRTIFFISERPSAFSYDDIYSDILGIYIATSVIKDNYNITIPDFENSVNRFFGITVAMLMPVSGTESISILQKLDGSWWSSRATWPCNRKILCRNINVGIMDGYITPVIVKHIPGYQNNSIQRLAVPLKPAGIDLKILMRYQTDDFKKMLNNAGISDSRILHPDDMKRVMALLKNDIDNELGRLQ